MASTTPGYQFRRSPSSKTGSTFWSLWKAVILTCRTCPPKLLASHLGLDPYQPLILWRLPVTGWFFWTWTNKLCLEWKKARSREMPVATPNVRIDWVESKWPRAKGRTRGYPAPVIALRCIKHNGVPIFQYLWLLVVRPAFPHCCDMETFLHDCTSNWRLTPPNFQKIVKNGTW